MVSLACRGCTARLSDQAGRAAGGGRPGVRGAGRGELGPAGGRSVRLDESAAACRDGVRFTAVRAGDEGRAGHVRARGAWLRCDGRGAPTAQGAVEFRWSCPAETGRGRGPAREGGAGGSLTCNRARDETMAAIAETPEPPQNPAGAYEPAASLD